MDNQEFHKRLMETFRVEAREHVTAMTECLDTLASLDGEDGDALFERIFREAHSLKGAARAVDARDIERICQALETQFSQLRKAGVVPDPTVLAALHQAVDLASDLIASPTHEGHTVTAVLNALKDAYGSGTPPRLATVPEAEQPAPPEPVIPEPIPPSALQPGAPDMVDAVESALPATLPAGRVRVETTRTSTAELERLFRKTEELFSTCMVQEAALERMARLRDVLHNERLELARHRRQANGTPLSGSDDILARQAAVLETSEAACSELVREWTVESRQLRRGVADLLDGVKRLQMLPLGTAFEALPRVVRNLAADCGKQVRLDITGSTVRIDRQIIENLNDPLLHLLRNAIDHGVEKPEVRKQLGKPENGTITIVARVADARTIEIAIADDGRGIDTEALKQRAVASGRFSQKEVDSLDDEALYGLAFCSGLTTSPIITDLSGRGLGLAIVQEKVLALGGTIRCSCPPEGGTLFQLRLPLNLTTTRVIAVQSNHVPFLIPGNFVARTLRIEAEAVETVGGRPIIHLHDRSVAVAALCDVLKLPGTASEADSHTLTAVLLRVGDGEAVLLVDEIGAEFEVIVKPLGAQLVRVPHISGASLSAGGRVELVLNGPDIVAAIRRGVESTGPDPSLAKPDTSPPHVLVVDDSVTSRTLLRDIMKTSGYRVDTAVDGMDAYTKLREGEFDLVVSDVDMPRLNGFEFVRKIRQDKHLEDIPVILVTSLDSREDRERGIEVGANAYIVKTRFDQSNLLEVAKRFV